MGLYEFSEMSNVSPYEKFRIRSFTRQSTDLHSKHSRRNKTLMTEKVITNPALPLPVIKGTGILKNSSKNEKLGK